MAKKYSGLLAIFWIAMTLIFAYHLFDIPGWIARHHQGYLNTTWGPWVTWVMAIMSTAVSAYNAVVYTRNWLRLRSAAVR